MANGDTSNQQRAKNEIEKRAKARAQAIRRSLFAVNVAQQRLFEVLSDLVQADANEIRFTEAEMEKASQELNTARRHLLDHIAICRHEEEA